MMHCDIIRDLLPSYIDGLTSEASTKLVEEHLAQCPQCRSCYEAMKNEAYPSPAATPGNLQDLQPLKKLNRKVKRRVIAAVLIAVVCCIGLFGGYQYFCNYGWLASSENVEIRYEFVSAAEYGDAEENSEGGVVGLVFHSKNEGRNLYCVTYHGDEWTYEVKEYFETPWSSFPVNGYCSVTFLDAEHYYNSDGTIQTIDDDDAIQVRFKDKTETFYLKDLAEQYVAES